MSETERVKSNSETQVKTQKSAIIKTVLTAIMQVNFKNISISFTPFGCYDLHITACGWGFAI